VLLVNTFVIVVVVAKEIRYLVVEKSGCCGIVIQYCNRQFSCCILVINQSINDVDKLHMSLYVCIVLKTLVLHVVFNNLSIKLRLMVDFWYR